MKLLSNLGQLVFTAYSVCFMGNLFLHNIPGMLFAEEFFNSDNVIYSLFIAPAAATLFILSLLALLFVVTLPLDKNSQP